jgi:TM2 domain-containing membrane protein YozV
MFFGKGKSKGREGKGKGRELVNGSFVGLILSLTNSIIDLKLNCMEMNRR